MTAHSAGTGTGGSKCVGNTLFSFFRIGLLSVLLVDPCVVVLAAFEGLRGLGPQQQKVEICHRTSTGKLVTIQVSENAIPAHGSHGDVIGKKCSELSCAETCQHQTCRDDFYEEAEEGTAGGGGTCICLPSPHAPTVCGTGATCNEAIDECECDTAGYVFDDQANCVPPAPPCTDDSIWATATQLEDAATADLCPTLMGGVEPAEIDCIIGFAYKEGSSTPFSFWNPDLPWGYSTDLATACGGVLLPKPSPTTLPVNDNTDACVLDIMYGTQYQDAQIYPHRKIFLWSDAWTHGIPSGTEEDAIYLTANKPYWIYQGPKGHRWNPSPANTCPLSQQGQSTVFDGRNFQCDIGDYYCGFVFKSSRSGMSSLSFPSPPPIADGYLTLQMTFWTEYLNEDDLPTTCPCWDPFTIDTVKTVVPSGGSECRWFQETSWPYDWGLTLADRRNGDGEAGVASQEASYTIFETRCTSYDAENGYIKGRAMVFDEPTI